MGSREEVGVLEILPVGAAQVEQAGEIEWGGEAEDLLLSDIDLMDEHVQHGLVDVVFDLEAHGRAADLASQQLLLECSQQVFGVVLLDLDVLVASHAEGGVGNDLHAGEETIEVSCDDLFQREVAALVHLQESGEQRRHLDAGELAATRRRIAEEHREVEGEARDVREGVRRIDCERREHWVDSLGEDRAHAVLLCRGEVLPAQELDPFGGEGRADVVLEDVGLEVDELVDALQEPVVQLLRQDAAGARLGDTCVDASLEACEAHHEEFVEVAREDGEELGALQQRHAHGVHRLVEDALVEFEPRQFAVVEATLGQGLKILAHAVLP